jgi:hypothetical protein
LGRDAFFRGNGSRLIAHGSFRQKHGGSENLPIPAFPARPRLFTHLPSHLGTILEEWLPGNSDRPARA